MTEENNVSYVVVNPIPRGGSSYFFDFINNQLSDIAEQMDGNDMALIDEMSSRRAAMGQSKEEIKEAGSRVVSLIKNRVAERKADMKNQMVVNNLKLLDKMKTAAMLKATVKAVVSYDADKSLNERIEEAQKTVDAKYNQKREEKLDKIKDVKREDGSIRSELRDIGKGIGGYLKNVFRLEQKKFEHSSNRSKLVQKRLAIGMLGVTTAPVKQAIDDVKFSYRMGKKVAKESFTWLNTKCGEVRTVAQTKANDFKIKAGNVWKKVKGGVVKGATSVKDGVVKGAEFVGNVAGKGVEAVKTGVTKAAKGVGRVATDSAKAFMGGAKQVWIGGKTLGEEFAGMIRSSVKEWGQEISQSKVGAFGRSLAGSAKSGVKAVKTEFNARRAANQAAKDAYSAYKQAHAAAGR